VYANSQIRVNHGLSADDLTGLFANAGVMRPSTS
jgi:hypothetical protein